MGKMIVVVTTNEDRLVSVSISSKKEVFNMFENIKDGIDEDDIDEFNKMINMKSSKKFVKSLNKFYKKYVLGELKTCSNKFNRYNIRCYMVSSIKIDGFLKGIK